jgi:carbon storage regulator
MLVIRRKPGESVLIGDGIEIEVIDLTPSRVKLGITAPASVQILRKEIQQAAEQNRLAARGVTPASIRDLLASLR